MCDITHAFKCLIRRLDYMRSYANIEKDSLKESMSFHNILMPYYLTVLVYTKTTTHISINGGYLKRHFAAL